MASNLTPASHWTQTRLTSVLSPIQKFIHSETAGGIVLMSVTVLALIIANSPLARAYDDLLHMYIGVSVGPFTLRETVLHWINDGLMAIFFFVVGLELKREALVGELADLRRAALPIVAALGGAMLPALFYIVVNRVQPEALAGACRWRPTSRLRWGYWRWWATGCRGRSKCFSPPLQ